MIGTFFEKIVVCRTANPNTNQQLCAQMRVLRRVVFVSLKIHYHRRKLAAKWVIAKVSVALGGTNEPGSYPTDR